MNYFMRETSRCINSLSGRINQIYGGRYYRTLITTENHFYNCYKYVYRNPVRAGIVERAEHYPFSTLRGLLGAEKLNIPIEEDQIIFGNTFGERALEWLNQSSKPAHEEQMKKSLKRREFFLPKDKTTGMAHYLNDGLL